MGSKPVNVNSAEATRNGFKGIADLLVIRDASASRPGRFLFSTDSPIPIGANTTVPNPVSIFALEAGANGDTQFAMRNPSESRPDAQFPLCGSGTTGTEFQVVGKYSTPSRNDQGEIEVFMGISPSGWPSPLIRGGA